MDINRLTEKAQEALRAAQSEAIRLVRWMPATS
jgi:hypothetical protein